LAKISIKLEVKYKRLGNELNTQLRGAKYNYFLEAFNASCANPKQIWNLINNELLRKPKNTGPKLPSELLCYQDPSRVALSDTEIAEELNSYFSNIDKCLASKFTNNDHQLSHSEISNSVVDLHICMCPCVVNAKLSPFPLLSVMNTYSLVLPFSLYDINNNFG